MLGWDSAGRKTGGSRYRDRGWKRSRYSGGKKRICTVSNLLLALVGTVMILCAAVVLVLNLRQIYYFDIQFLNLTEKTGLDDWIIRENYDTLIDYNLVTKQVEQLEFPSFPMSEEGRIHFEEVKRIFVMIQYLGAASLAVFLAGFFHKTVRGEFGFLKLTSVLTLLLPALPGAAVALDWERFFVRFHELFFSNDYWLFDPATDPVITILPDTFFLHCAAAVLLCILLGSALCRLLYRVFAGRRR